MKGAIDLEALHRRWPRRAEIPFDSTSKMMATVHSYGRAQPGWRILIKGAPEAVLELCSGDAVIQARGHGAAEVMAENALRVLALAEAQGAAFDDRAGFEQFKGRVKLLGLVGQMDPPRSVHSDTFSSSSRQQGHLGPDSLPFGSTPPSFEIQIISEILEGLVITAGSGKIYSI